MTDWLDLVALPTHHLQVRHTGVVVVRLVQAFLWAEMLARLATVVVHPVMEVARLAKEALRQEVEDAPVHCAHHALRLLRKDCARGLRLIWG